MTRFSAISICLIILVLTLVSPKHSHAQNSQQDYLDAHNVARAAVGVADIAWDTTVEAYAQAYANQMISDCNLVHSNGPYGENLAMGSSPSFSGVDAVNLFVDEKQFYTYSTNTCDPGEVCGHYTQVVWSDTTHVGCARVQCTSGWIYVVCSYNPPGNVVGQWPY